jgi:hypothetical protein
LSIEQDTKPKSFLETLGPKVEMESRALEPNAMARERLRDLGKMVSEQFLNQGMEYVGSFAIHILKSKDGYGVISGEYHMDTITQIALDENISEQMAMLGFNNAVIQLRRYFNPDLKLGRRGDRR